MPEPLLPISACLIARDEERVIEGAIRSVDFAAHVVVIIDTRSGDRTAEVARGAGREGQEVEVVHRAWHGHVDQKNFALSRATHEWVLCLDADESVSPSLRWEILELFRAPGPDLAGYTCPRRSEFLGRWIRHGGWYPDRKLRLFRRSRGRWGGTDPHDRVVLEGRAGKLQGDLLHRSFESIRDHIDKMDGYTGTAARRMHERGVRFPVIRMFLHPPARFLGMYLLRRGFLDGAPGLLLACLASFYTYLKYARLWELGALERRAREHGAVPTADPDVAFLARSDAGAEEARG